MKKEHYFVRPREKTSSLFCSTASRKLFFLKLFVIIYFSLSMLLNNLAYFCQIKQPILLDYILFWQITSMIYGWNNHQPFLKAVQAMECNQWYNYYIGNHIICIMSIISKISLMVIIYSISIVNINRFAMIITIINCVIRIHIIVNNCQYHQWQYHYHKHQFHQCHQYHNYLQFYEHTQKAATRELQMFSWGNKNMYTKCNYHPESDMKLQTDNLINYSLFPSTLLRHLIIIFTFST